MLAKGVREQERFMWLAWGQQPDLRRLNEFRGKMLKMVMEGILVTGVKLLKAKGYMRLEHSCSDGTKIESAAGPYPTENLIIPGIVKKVHEYLLALGQILPRAPAMYVVSHCGDTGYRRRGAAGYKPVSITAFSYHLFGRVVALRVIALRVIPILDTSNHAQNLLIAFDFCVIFCYTETDSNRREVG